MDLHQLDLRIDDLQHMIEDTRYNVSALSDAIQYGHATREDVARECVYLGELLCRYDALWKEYNEALSHLTRTEEEDEAYWDRLADFASDAEYQGSIAERMMDEAYPF